MTPEEVKLVQSSWKQVVPIQAQAADIFYSKLFELDPEVRQLFPEDLSEQKRLLMRMLGTAVNGLNDLEALVPAVEELGRRHKGYGVKDAHYATVGEALLFTLQQGLGEGFMADVRDAWAKVYTVLASTMQSAANEL